MLYDLSAKCKDDGLLPEHKSYQLSGEPRMMILDLNEMLPLGGSLLAYSYLRVMSISSGSTHFFTMNEVHTNTLILRS